VGCGRPQTGSARLREQERPAGHLRPDRRLFGRDGGEDQVGWIDGALARFGRSYTGEPDVLAAELAQDAAVAAADTILLTVPNQLGVDYNARLLETIVRHIAPAIGWSPAPSTA
jgi:hypothetical protein